MVEPVTAIAEEKMLQMKLKQQAGAAIGVGVAKKGGKKKGGKKKGGKKKKKK